MVRQEGQKMKDDGDDKGKEEVGRRHEKKWESNVEHGDM